MLKQSVVQSELGLDKKIQLYSDVWIKSELCLFRRDQSLGGKKKTTTHKTCMQQFDITNLNHKLKIKSEDADKRVNLV